MYTAGFARTINKGSCCPALQYHLEGRALFHPGSRVTSSACGAAAAKLQARAQVMAIIAAMVRFKNKQGATARRLGKKYFFKGLTGGFFFALVHSCVLFSTPPPNGGKGPTNKLTRPVRLECSGTGRKPAKWYQVMKSPSASSHKY